VLAKTLGVSKFHAFCGIVFRTPENMYHFEKFRCFVLVTSTVALQIAAQILVHGNISVTSCNVYIPKTALVYTEKQIGIGINN
jgi:hypothetical protein